jgi:O-succinylbenzoic acid--CoA ligase
LLLVNAEDLPHRLAAALDGSGPALRVLGPAAGRPPASAASEGQVTDGQVDDEVALVVTTSGSTGRPREVLLSTAALTASATATAARLGGHGQWLLALPTDHVAGLQVQVRSALAGTVPVQAPPGPFRAAELVAGAARLAPGTRHYTSLVPTQLVRLLDSPGAVEALAGFDAVLVGGAALPEAVRDRATALGVPLVTTYGATETCGGAVYDGRPLPGVQLRVGADGRVRLAGPVLARGYRGRPDLDATTFVQQDGDRWFVTSDLGRIGPDGRLQLLGRADDVLISGGVNVAPAAVEAVLGALPGVQEVCVVGVPDEQWGQSVTAVVVPEPGRPPALAQLREAATLALGPAGAPRSLVLVDALPLRGPGKPDRRAAAALAVRRLAGDVRSEREARDGHRA